MKIPLDNDIIARLEVEKEIVCLNSLVISSV